MRPPAFGGAKGTVRLKSLKITLFQTGQTDRMLLWVVISKVTAIEYTAESEPEPSETTVPGEFLFESHYRIHYFSVSMLF